MSLHMNATESGKSYSDHTSGGSAEQLPLWRTPRRSDSLSATLALRLRLRPSLTFDCIAARWRFVRIVDCHSDNATLDHNFPIACRGLDVRLHPARQLDGAEARPVQQFY